MNVLTFLKLQIGRLREFQRNIGAMVVTGRLIISKFDMNCDSSNSAKQLGQQGHAPMVFKILQCLKAFKKKRNFENRTKIDSIRDLTRLFSGRVPI